MMMREQQWDRSNCRHFRIDVCLHQRIYMRAFVNARKKNFTFLFKCTPVGAWALRLNDGTELKLSYRWEGPDNKLRLRDKHMSMERHNCLMLRSVIICC